MRCLAPLILTAALVASPLAAQDEGAANGAEDGTEDRGLSLMQEGARLLFEGLMKEMEPAAEDLRALAETIGPEFQEMMREMGPALRDLAEQIEDFSAYHPPEMLPNGDIILRKKTPADLPPPEDTEI